MAEKQEGKCSKMFYSNGNDIIQETREEEQVFHCKLKAIHLLYIRQV